MADIHTIHDYPGNNQYSNNEQDARLREDENHYLNPMMNCCQRLPIITILISSVEFILWFALIFVDHSIWEPQTCTNPKGIEEGEVWRLITPSILHNGYLQIFFDIIFMFLIGVQTELQIGSICFIWLSVLFTILTYLVNFVISGIFYWAGATSVFYTYCSFGLYPMQTCYIILLLRLMGSKWSSFFMIFPIPAALLPFLFVGLSLLISFDYRPCILLLSSVIVGFLSWTGVLRFIVPKSSCFRSCEKKCCPRLSRWPHWSDARVSDNVRHFPVKMGEGPEPITCCCNRWKPVQGIDVEDGGWYRGYQVQTMNNADRNHDSASKKAKKAKKKAKKIKKNISCDTSTSSLDSWKDSKDKGRKIGNNYAAETEGIYYNPATNSVVNSNPVNNKNNKKDKKDFKGKARHF